MPVALNIRLYIVHVVRLHYTGSKNLVTHIRVLEHITTQRRPGTKTSYVGFSGTGFIRFLYYSHQCAHSFKCVRSNKVKHVCRPSAFLLSAKPCHIFAGKIDAFSRCLLTLLFW